MYGLRTEVPSASGSAASGESWGFGTSRDNDAAPSADHVLIRQKDSPAMTDVEAALDEMLFSGGTLNVKLLGGAGSE